MAVTINSNIAASNTTRRLSIASAKLESTFERLASGQRINRASDDAAGLAIAKSLNTDSRVFTAAIRNVNDGLSSLAIAEGALRELAQIATRQMELAEQAANGTYSLQQRKSLHTEANALTDEFNRVVQSTKFNGVQLLDGSLDDIRIQAGYGLDGSLRMALNSELGRQIGDGTFNPVVSYLLPGGAVTAIESGDFNRDGKVDLAAMGATGTYIRLGNGDGTFSLSSLYSSGTTWEVKSIDLNEDGILDLTTTDATNMQILVGNGDGTFKAPTTYETTSSITRGFDFGDFNNDGNIDIVASDFTGGYFSILAGNGDGTFKARASYNVGVSAVEVTLAYDANNDGVLDIVSGGNANGQLTKLFLGNGDGTFRAIITLTSDNGGLQDAQIADVNEDGYQDLLLGSFYTNSVSVLLSNGDGTFTYKGSYFRGSGPYALETGDVNRDGITDLFSIGDDGDSLNVLVGNLDGSFKAPTSVALTTTIRMGLAVGDFNGDGVIDAAGGTVDEAGLKIYISKTTRSTQIERLYLLSQSGARSALETSRETLNRINLELGLIGSLQSRLAVASKNIQTSIENYRGAEGRITDVDVAEATAELNRHQITQQAATSVLAQANQAPALALTLLR